MKVKFLQSIGYDKIIDRYSCGGALKLSEVSFENFFDEIEATTIRGGGLWYKKIFLHSYDISKKYRIFIKQNPLAGLLFLLYHNNYFEEPSYRYTFPQIVDVFKENGIRLFTTFRVYEDKLNKVSDTIKLECPFSIPFKYKDDTNLIPDDWKELLWNYIPSVIDIGDDLVIYRKTCFGTEEIFRTKVVDISNWNNCRMKYFTSSLSTEYFIIQVNPPIPLDVNLYSEHDYVSNILNFDYELSLRVVNFERNSSYGNYVGVIETNRYGTIYEEWLVEFTSETTFTVKAINNNLVVGEGNIDSDFEPINIFLDYDGNNYPFFKINKDGWVGNFNEGDTFKFTTIGKEIPIWIMLYYPLNMNYPIILRDKMILEVEEYE